VWRRRKKYVGQEWATKDARWATTFVILLFLGAFYTWFLYAALGVVVYFAVRFTVMGVRYWRREHSTAEHPYWLDDLPKD